MTVSRTAKRAIIAAIFLSIVFLLFTGVYFAFIKSPESCFDAKKNQDEQGVDCGGVCTMACKEIVTGEDFQIKELSYVPGGNNQYDVLAKLYNPNDQAGASSFRYEFELKDDTGNVIVSRSGQSYILPQETKDIIELNLETPARPAVLSIQITNIEWEKLAGFREKPSLNIYQKRYNQIVSGVGFGEAYGVVSNESPYDFRSLTVKVILRDAAGQLLALNTTEMRSVSSGEERDFRLIWPAPFEGIVEKVDMVVDADVYHSDNFMKQYFPGGRFQDTGAPEPF